MLKSDKSNSIQWQNTRSCWQGNRQVSVNGKYRQCGVCAACMLRRLAIFSAGIDDVNLSYACENLKAYEFNLGFAPSFASSKITGAMREYAIAGTLHLEDLASLPNTLSWKSSQLVWIKQLSDCLNISRDDVMQKLNRLLNQHNSEWTQFKTALGPSSFINKWIGGATL